MMVWGCCALSGLGQLGTIYRTKNSALSENLEKKNIQSSLPDLGSSVVTGKARGTT